MHRRPSLALVAATLFLGTTLAVARPAHAQLGGAGGTGGVGGTTGTLTNDDFFIGVQETKNVNLNTFQVARFFNQARCNCAAPVYVFLGLTASGAAKRATITAAGSLSLWIGTNCNDPLYFPQCTKIPGSDQQLITFANVGSFIVLTDANLLSTPRGVNAGVVGVDGGTGDAGVTSTGPCSASQPFQQTIWALIDTDANGTFDLFPSIAVNVDLAPPPAPVVAMPEGGSEALVLHWTAVDATIAPDILGYQVLCQRGPGLQVFKSGTFGAAYQICPSTAVGTGIDALDVNYTCSPQLSPSTTSFRVEILQNGIFYGASVVAMDQSGNPAASPVQFAQPAKTLSFYDVYREPPNAGAAAGGLCALAPGARPSLPLALALSALLVLRSARRRRR